MQPTGLVLRDIHQPVAPSWWPPAPGWWLVFATVLIVLAIATTWWLRRRRRRAAVARAFDDALRAAPTPVAQIAAASDLLRRAARRHEPAADTLPSIAWLRFLDGTRTERPFSEGPGRLLLDGGFRAEVAASEVAAALPIARRRYLELMAVRG